MDQGNVDIEASAVGGLVNLVDNGPAVPIDSGPFIPSSRSASTQGWGVYAENFLSVNRSAIQALGLTPEIRSSPRQAKLCFRASDKIGAVPLKSVANGRIAGGVVVAPRFGWRGIGSVLSQIGWAAMPNILALPSVPGSGREIPSWVIAGPVLHRIEALLRNLKRGYQEREEVLRRPRGTILWGDYIKGSLARGHWDRLPCRFPDLAADPRLRGMARWTIERVYASLVRSPEQDQVASALIQLSTHLLANLSDVMALFPTERALQAVLRGSLIASPALRAATEAMEWVVEDRGLGGGRTLDGLSWALALDQLWEAYVEAIYRKEAAMTGASLLVGRKHETIVPVQWMPSWNRSLGHLVPDLVLQKGATVEIVDAKYKAHLAEIDAFGWRNLREEVQDAHRADLHQILAYAALYDAEVITATLVYPMPEGLWKELHAKDLDITRAEMNRGSRHILLKLRGLPFGVRPRA